MPWFSNILERIVYNRLYEHLNSNNILYKKQFGFQKGHTTEHAILQSWAKYLTRNRQTQ